MDRRAFLVTAAGLCSGVAGCTGRNRPGNTPESASPGGRDTPSPSGDASAASPSAEPYCGVSGTASPGGHTGTTRHSATGGTPTPDERTLPLGERYESPDGRTVAVRGVRVRKLVRSKSSVGSPTHVDVACADDGQFAVLEAEASAADGHSILSGLQFALEVDGELYAEAERSTAFRSWSDDPVEFPALPVPVLDAGRAAVVWLPEDDPPVRWILPAETVERFGRAPNFTVCSFVTPDAVSRGDRFEATFTVANTGTRKGDFIAEVGAGGVSDHGEVVRPVPAGAERSHSEWLTAHYAEGMEEISVTLGWGCNRLDRTVAVTD